MPLHVNLYHEVQRQERARQRDPLRLGMLAVLIIAIGFVVNYFVALGHSHSIGVRYADLQGAWAGIEPKEKAAKARQDELNTQIAASDAMKKNVDSRLFMAPILAEILKSVPRSIQLTHVGADAPADDKALTSVLTISGISGAVEPRKAAEAIRTALEARLAAKFKHVTSAFKSLDDSDQVVMLDGHHLATASFIMEFQIQVRDPVVVAPPTLHKSRSAEAE